MPALMTCREALSRKLAEIDGLTLAPSRFGHEDPSWWFRGAEILHFHGTDAVDLRLGRKLIRARRDQFREDLRVKLRPSSSADWVELLLGSSKDVPFVVQLVKAAVGAED
jgi:hypothetical protein